MPRHPKPDSALDPQLGLLKSPAQARPEPAGAALVSRPAQRYASEPGAIFAFDDGMAQHLRELGEHTAVELHDLVRKLDYSAFGGTETLGRRPFAPWIFVGLVCYGLLHGVRSLRELERLARMDLGAIYICGGLRPDHSTIGQFLHENATLLAEEFFTSIVRRLAGRLGVRRGTTAIDGTVVQAAASAYRNVTAEAARMAAEKARQQAAEQPQDARLQQTAEQATEVATVAGFRQSERDGRRDRKATPVKVSSTEPDSVVQPLKEGPVRPAYKPSIQVHESGLIVGQHVDMVSEQAAIAPLLEQHEAALGGAPERTLLDAGYHDPGTLQQFVDRNVDVLCPAGKHDHLEAKQCRQIPKSRFAYDAEQDRFRCPQGRLLVLERAFEDDDGRPLRRYRCEDCSDCPLHPQCCRTGGTRTLKRYEGDDIKQAAASILRHPVAKRLYAQRKVVVEPVFARLKQRQGLRRFLRRGRVGAALEFALHCIAYNLGLAARRLAAVLAVLLALLLASKPGRVSPRRARSPLAPVLPAAQGSPVRLALA
jgi:transposase